jgi:hypothetical protein
VPLIFPTVLLTSQIKYWKKKREEQKKDGVVGILTGKLRRHPIRFPSE